MKYETPRLTPLTPAVNAIQTLNKAIDGMNFDTPYVSNELSGGYTDWEF